MLAINNRTKHRIAIRKTKKLVEAFFVFYQQKNWDVSLAIVGDRTMRRLNRKYRQIDKTTDVLSFRESKLTTNYLGEVIINVEELKRKDRYQTIFSPVPPFQYLFNFILVHGLLHLLGYHDETEKERQKMIQLGHAFLDRFSGYNIIGSNQKVL